MSKFVCVRYASFILRILCNNLIWETSLYFVIIFLPVLFYAKSILETIRTATGSYESCAHVLKSNNFCQKPWTFPPNLWVITWCSSRNAASKMSPYENRHVHLFQFSTVRLKVWGDGSPQDLFWSSGEKPFSWVPLGSKTLPVCPNWDCCYKRLVHTDICAKYFLTIFLKIGTFISYLTSMFLAFIVMFWTVSLKQTLHCHSMLQGLSQHAFTAPTNLFIYIFVSQYSWK